MKDGVGVPLDLDKAVLLYRMSAGQGNESSKRALERLGK